MTDKKSVSWTAKAKTKKSRRLGTQEANESRQSLISKEDRQKHKADRSVEREKHGRYDVYAYKEKQKTAERAKQIGHKQLKYNTPDGSVKIAKKKAYKCDDEKACGAVGKKARHVKHEGGNVFTGSRGGLYKVVNGKKIYVTNRKSVNKRLN